MGRLVDADALLAEYDRVHVGPPGGARKLIEDAPTVKPKPEWIPCSKRMPEQDGTYIVSGVWASGKKATGECEYMVEDGYFNASWSFAVRAWMPLPEPYGEENNE